MSYTFGALSQQLCDGDADSSDVDDDDDAAAVANSDSQAESQVANTLAVPETNNHKCEVRLIKPWCRVSVLVVAAAGFLSV